MAPVTARELNGKRKREHASEEEEEDDDDKENETAKRWEEENVCPNSGVEKTTPVRKAKGQTKGGQKLFSSRGDGTKVKGTGERDN